MKIRELLTTKEGSLRQVQRLSRANHGLVVLAPRISAAGQRTLRGEGRERRRLQRLRGLLSRMDAQMTSEPG